MGAGQWGWGWIPDATTQEFGGFCMLVSGFLCLHLWINRTLVGQLLSREYPDFAILRSELPSSRRVGPLEIGERSPKEATAFLSPFFQQQKGY